MKLTEEIVVEKELLTRNLQENWGKNVEGSKQKKNVEESEHYKN